ncbi:hypothetical protein HK099_000005 [Clydaea vesicula]|uniref:Uncharacterized protein n=1 Tax=Clydaea vesicula TaxID=447962 RepID=A0AAD5Y3X0_9FUNG|nr:hypothetical protein HK099_000005 [Clydaea vesicula]
MKGSCNFKNSIPPEIWIAILNIVFLQEPRAIYSLLLVNSFFYNNLSILVYQELTFKVIDNILFDEEEEISAESNIEEEEEEQNVDFLYQPKKRNTEKLENQNSISDFYLNSRIKKFLTSLKNFKENRKNLTNSKIKNPFLYVKKLTLDSDNQKFFIEHLGLNWVQVLLDNMPNLSSISFLGLLLDDYQISVIKQCKNVESLQLYYRATKNFSTFPPSYRTFDKGFVSLINNLKKLRSLELNLEKKSLSPESFLYLFKKVPNLKKLILLLDSNEFYEFLNDFALRINQNLKNLQILHLSTFSPEFCCNVKLRRNTINLIINNFKNSFEFENKFDEEEDFLNLYPDLTRSVTHKKILSGKKKNIDNINSFKYVGLTEKYFHLNFFLFEEEMYKKNEKMYLSLDHPAGEKLWKSKPKPGEENFGILRYYKKNYFEENSIEQNFSLSDLFKPVIRGVCLVSTGMTHSRKKNEPSSENLISLNAEKNGKTESFFVKPWVKDDIQIPLIEDDFFFYILLNNNASLLNDLLENIDYLIGDLIKSYTDKTFDNIIHPRMNQKILTFNDIQGYLGNIRDLSEVRSAKVDQNLSFCNINTSSGSRRIFWPVKYYYPIDEKKGWQDSLKIAEIKVPSDYKLKFPENDNLIYGKLLPLFDISDSMQLNMNSNSVSVICNECNSEFDESEFEFLNISDDEVISSQKKINNVASESYEATALKRNSSSKLKTDLREEIEKEWDFC